MATSREAANSGMGYFDRDGKPISLDRYVELRQQAGDDYKRIASTTLDEDGDGQKRVVSTVWLGHNHNFNPNGPPLIFETMIYALTGDDAVFDDYQERYTTETEALAGHERAVEHARASSHERVAAEQARPAPPQLVRRPWHQKL